MDKKEKKDTENKKNQSLEEQAIDENATRGEQINQQVKDKREHHQPRDTA
jgi:hypothetical protein